MIRKTLGIILCFTNLLIFSYGENNVKEIDMDKYHKLQTSSVYFSSVKGRSFFIGIGFYKTDREKYLSGKIDRNKIFGSMTIYSLNPSEPQVLTKVYLKDESWHLMSRHGAIEDILVFTGVGESDLEITLKKKRNI